MSATPEESFQSKGVARPMQVVDVWLEAGREGRTFTYVDHRQLGVSLGDLVVVRLRGRRLQGLVTASRPLPDDEQARSPHLQPVEALLQRAAVDSDWQAWLDAMAASCHTSSFRMLKAALPPGWLGQRAKPPASGRKLWWVALLPAGGAPPPQSARQQALLESLKAAGGGAWQRDLLTQGFHAGMVQSLQTNGYLHREQRLAPASGGRRWSGGGALQHRPSMGRTRGLHAPRSRTSTTFSRKGPGCREWGRFRYEFGK